jgi:MFS family permease
MKTPTGTLASTSWFLASALAMVHLVSSVDRHLLALVLSAVKADLLLSDAQLGFLHGTAYVILYALAIVPAGALADRFDRRKIIMFALVTWTIGTVACAVSQSFIELVFFRMLVGMGQAALVPSAMAMIAEAFGPARMGRPVALFTAAATVGRGLALLGGGLLLAWIVAGDVLPLLSQIAPWRAVLLASIALNLAALAVFAVTGTSRTPGNARKNTVPVAGLFRDRWPIYLAYLGGAVSSIMLVQIVAAWTPTILVRSFALTSSQSGILFGPVVLVFGPLGNLCAGWLLDHLERRAVAGGAGAINAVALIAAVLSASLFCLAGTLPLAVSGMAAMTFFLGMATPTGLVGIQKLSPSDARGRVTGAFLLCVTLMSLGIGPLAVGWLSDSVTGAEDGLRLAVLAAFICIGCVGTISACLALRLDQCLDRPVARRLDVRASASERPASISRAERRHTD